MDIKEKEVNFFTYCPLCKFSEVNGNDSPCDECLAEPTNKESSRPVKFESRKMQAV